MKVMRALLEWLIPASTLFGPFEQVRARVFSGLCLLLFAVGNVRAVGFLWVGDYPVALGYLLLAGTTGAAIHLVRRGWGLWWPTHGTILLVWALVTLVSAKRGGVGASLLAV